MRSLFVTSVLLVLGSSALAHADGGSPSESAAWLREFRKDPVAKMGELPPKRAYAEGATPDAPAASAPEVTPDTKQAARGNHCMLIDGVRTCLDDPRGGRAAPLPGDFADVFFSNPRAMVRGLEQMERRGLRAGRSNVLPWTSDYWATYKGGLGFRYADRDMPRSGQWNDFFSYAGEGPGAMPGFLSARGDAGIAMLSPSEKYDLLVGDGNLTMTQGQWRQGRAEFQAKGSVATWQGICHGWAPASYRVPEPRKSVTVAAAGSGKPIVFYPADIRALASLMWANMSFDTVFMGGRCQLKKPQVKLLGGEIKRIGNQECLDTNPASWHLTVVNKIGVEKSNVVFDATYDQEVWNQPLYSYSYRYFNPRTLDVVERLQDARVSLQDFKDDLFRAYRDPRAKSVVGVAMEVAYGIEMGPTVASPSVTGQSALRSATYHYDLELDEQGNIVGGEWYTLAHPDFVWDPAVAELTPGIEYTAGAWDPSRPFPAEWTAVARHFSGLGRGAGAVPLGIVVRKLVELSSGR